MKEKVTAKKKPVYVLALEGGRVLLKNSDGLHPLNNNDILYVKAAGNQAAFYTTSPYPDQQQIVISNKLGEAAGVLCFFPFLRVHKSWIINVTHIRRLAPKHTHVTIDKERIPVSRQHREEFLALVQQHIFTTHI